MNPKTAILWLKLAIELQFVLGATMILAGIPLFGNAFGFLVNLVIDTASPATPLTAESRLLAVIGGGVLIGWAFFAWHITTTQIEAGDPRGVRALLIGLMLWFCTDSGGSILAGAPLNAVANLAYLVLFLPPLVSLMRARPLAASA
jgi:hypothetical protein